MAEKINFFDDLKYNVEESECTLKVFENVTELICSPNGAKEQEVRFRSANLKIKFNKDGDFKEAFTSRYVDSGFAGTFASSPFLAYTCDEDGETTEKSPIKTKAKDIRDEDTSNDED